MYNEIKQYIMVLISKIVIIKMLYLKNVIIILTKLTLKMCKIYTLFHIFKNFVCDCIV